MAIVAIVFIFVDIHVWSQPARSDTILVPTDKLVQFNGKFYIPVQFTPSLDQAGPMVEIATASPQGSGGTAGQSTELG